MSLAATLFLNAVVATLVLALAALGLAIIFGLMGVINLAHGAFIAVGAYVAWFATTQGNFWVALLAAPLVVGTMGYLIEATVVKRLYYRPLDTILATWGIAMIIQEGLKLAFGVTTKSVPLPIEGSLTVGPVTYPGYRLLLVVAGTVVVLAVLALLLWTDLGIRLRAVIEDADAAELLGVHPERLYRLGFSLGAALAGLAGALLAPITTVSPAMGQIYLVESFFAVILGGSTVGVVLGSAIVGGSGSILTFAISPLIAEALVFVAAILVVVARPEGILTR